MYLSFIIVNSLKCTVHIDDLISYRCASYNNMRELYLQFTHLSCRLINNLEYTDNLISYKCVGYTDTHELYTIHVFVVQSRTM